MMNSRVSCLHLLTKGKISRDNTHQKTRTNVFNSLASFVAITHLVAFKNSYHSVVAGRATFEPLLLLHYSKWRYSDGSFNDSFSKAGVQLKAVLSDNAKNEWEKKWWTNTSESSSICRLSYARLFEWFPQEVDLRLIETLFSGKEDIKATLLWPLSDLVCWENRLTIARVFRSI